MLKTCKKMTVLKQNRIKQILRRNKDRYEENLEKLYLEYGIEDLSSLYDEEFDDVYTFLENECGL